MTAQDDQTRLSHLAEAETTLEALRRQEVDAVVGDSRILLLRLRETEQALRESEQHLRALNKSLERRVAARTAALKRQTQRLRQLANELTEAEQQERKKLARTLHDGLQQILIGMEIHLDLFAVEGDPEALEHAQKLLGEAIQASHSLAYELAPPVLYESNLANALAWLADWFGKNHRFQVSIDVSAEMPILPESTKVFLFTAVRELLLNSVKHSGVQAAVVRCARAGNDELQIAVRDEGRGFDPAALEKGFGLLSIRERLIALGGSLEIAAAPGAGTRFVIHFPLDREEPDAPRHRMNVPGAAVDGAGAGETAPSLTAPGQRIRILLVDDHCLVREGLAALLQRQANCEIVGEAEDGVAAVELVEQLLPDVVLMNIHLPRMDGIAITQRIKEAQPTIHVVGLAGHAEADNVQALRAAGAAACLGREVDAGALVETLRALCGKASVP